MKFNISSTEKFARERFYQKYHVEVVDIPDESLPHDLRVWLVDNYHQGMISERIDAPTAMMVVDALYAIKGKQEKDIRDMVSLVLACEPSGLIARVPGGPYKADEAYVSRVIGSKSIDWSHPDLKQTHDMLTLEVNNINADAKVEFEKRKREAWAAEEAKIADRKEKVRSVIHMMAAATQQPNLIEWYESGMMPEDDQRKFIKDAMFGLEFEVHRKLRQSDLPCNCGADVSYSSCVVTTVPKDAFERLSEIKESFNGADVAFETCYHEVCCDECGITRNVHSLKVSATVGDWTVYRRFAL